MAFAKSTRSGDNFAVLSRSHDLSVISIKHTCTSHISVISTHEHVRVSQLQILQVILAPMSLKQLIYISLDINCPVKQIEKIKYVKLKEIEKKAETEQ